MSWRVGVEVTAANRTSDSSSKALHRLFSLAVLLCLWRLAGLTALGLFTYALEFD